MQVIVERLLWRQLAGCHSKRSQDVHSPTCKRLGARPATMRRAVAKLGVKSRVIVERPLLILDICAKRLERCQMLVNDSESASAGRVIIFSDEKTWSVDPVRNRRNDRYPTYHLGKRTRVSALCQKRNIQHPSYRSFSLPLI